MAYPTTAQLVDASSQDELNALTPVQQDALRQASIAAIEAHCGQSFTAEVATHTLRGTGGDTLLLPRRLAAVTDVVLGGAALTLSDLQLGDDFDRLVLPAPFPRNYYERTLATLDGWGPRTWDATLDVAVTGTWGWVDPPDAVVTALRYDMEDQAAADASGLSGAVQAYRKLGIRGISQGNLNAQLNGGGSVSPRVQRLLEGLQWQGAGGYLA
jgi:hypothetical protein